MKTVSQSNSRPFRKPSRTAKLIDRIAPEKLATLKGLFNRGMWTMAKVRAAIASETGIKPGGTVSIHNLFLSLTGKSIGSCNLLSSIYRLDAAQRETIKAWWVQNPQLSYRAVQERIAREFGREISSATIFHFYHAECAPQFGARSVAVQKTVELSVKVLDGGNVTGETKLALKLNAPARDPEEQFATRRIALPGVRKGSAPPARNRGGREAI